jgi:hypothetical protein
LPVTPIIPYSISEYDDFGATQMKLLGKTSGDKCRIPKSIGRYGLPDLPDQNAFKPLSR